MKKLVALSLLLSIALWLGGTAYIAHAFKDGQSDYAALTNQDFVDKNIPVKLELGLVEHGFFSSTSRLQLNVGKTTDNEEKSLIVYIDQTSYHGPLMWTAHGLKFGANYLIFTPDISAIEDSDERAALLSAFGDQAPIEIGLLLGFGQNHQAYARISPFHYVDENSGAAVSLDQGITVSGSANEQFSRMKANATFGPFAIEDTAQGGRVSISDSELRIDMTEIYAGSMLAGTVDYRLDKVDIQQEDKGVSLENIAVTGSSDNNDGNLSGQSSMLIEKVATTLPDSVTMLEGPLNFQIDLHYSGLDEAAIKQLADHSQRLNQQLYLSLLSGNIESIVADEFVDDEVKNFQLMAALIKQGLAFDYKILLANEDARADLALDFSWVDQQSLMDKQSLGEVLKAFQSQLVLDVEKALIVNTPLQAMIQMPVNMGYAIETEDRFLSTLDFNEGELRLNDKPIPYLDMLGSAVDKPLPWR